MTSLARKPDETQLWHSEILITDLVGRLIEFWGFRRNMGRVWAILYLRPQPQNANEIRAALKLSAGAVSMTLQELLRWGVVRRVWVPGDRRDYFTAEVQLWKMVSRVLSERERTEIGNAIEACEQALEALEHSKSSDDAEERGEQAARWVGDSMPDGGAGRARRYRSAAPFACSSRATSIRRRGRAGRRGSPTLRLVLARTKVLRSREEGRRVRSSARGAATR